MAGESSFEEEEAAEEEPSTPASDGGAVESGTFRIVGSVSSSGKEETLGFLQHAYPVSIRRNKDTVQPSYWLSVLLYDDDLCACVRVRVCVCVRACA